MPEIGILFWTLYGKTEKTWMNDLLTFRFREGLEDADHGDCYTWADF